MPTDLHNLDLPAHCDVVIVGGGHNALIAAAYLLDAGRSVVILEQMDHLGGWVQTTELATPGFQHDLYGAVQSAFLGGPVWAELGPELQRCGLSYVNGPVASGASLADGRSVVVPVDPEAWATELDRLGERGAWDGLLGSASWLPSFFELSASAMDEPSARRALAEMLDADSGRELPFGTLLTQSALTFAATHFQTAEMRFLAAPWALHYGLGPEDTAGALWTLLMLAGFAGGGPIPTGGSGKLVEAIAELCLERGARVHTGVDVEAILISGGRAHGVRTATGETVIAGEAVLASVTPDVLYGRLLREARDVPQAARIQAGRYRYGRGCLQINLALSQRPHFRDPRLDGGGAINLGHGVDALRDMVREADAGLLPRHPVLSWHEPTAVDPTRAPQGRATARLQVIGVPYVPRGDAAGQLTEALGWDPSTTEAFADRVLAEAEAHLPGLGDLVIERHVTTPADLAAANPNAGPGDHVGGVNTLDQTLIARPIPAHRGGYRTTVPGLWMTGAATWPGGGITGLPGRSAARAIVAAGDLTAGA